MLAALLREVDEPPQRERVGAGGPYVDGDLVGRATDAAGLNLNHGAYVIQRGFNQFYSRSTFVLVFNG